MRAMEALPGGMLEVEIIGDGPEREHLKEMARGVAGSVSFRGSLAPREVADALATADALVLPSASEGRPVVVLEAMAAGVPVIATDIPGTRELVSHGETGLLFEPDDELGLASALRSISLDASLRERLGAQGQKSLNERGLTGAKAAERHLAVYRAVKQGHRAPAAEGSRQVRE